MPAGQVRQRGEKVQKSACLKTILAATLILFAVPMVATPVAAAEVSATAIDTGDTAWLLISTALVFLMVPAVGFFYGGMLRKESFLSMLGQTIIIMGLVTIIWFIAGYSLAFGPDSAGLIGNLDNAFLDGVGVSPGKAAYMPSTVPELLYMLFQLMFAVVTVCLLIGGIAERMRLKHLIAFLGIWTLLVYVPVAHWVWGGGWILDLGALDFAGGTVVHITAGVSVLAAVLVLGRRVSAQNGRGDHPHSVPMVVLGAGLLMFGWFGFNGGSALSSGALAAVAAANTMIAASVAGVVWGLVNWLHLGRPGVLGLASGMIAGLVAITPACGYVAPSGAFVIGMCAGVVCYGGILLRKRLGFDDALDVWGVHGLGGTMGALATGIFAVQASYGGVAVGANGLLAGGGFDLLFKQAIAVATVWAFAFSVTFIALKVMDHISPVRMTKDEERIGADIIQHGEQAYQ
jgi:Amt family ammonium transporter